MRLQNPKVTVMARVKVDGNWRRFPAAYGANGKIRPGVVKMDATVDKEFDQWSYELLYYQKGQKCYKPVGKGAAEAEAQRIILSNQLSARSLAKAAGLEVVEEKPRVTLRESCEAYVKYCAGRPRAEYDASLVTTDFINVSRLTFVDQVTKGNIIDYHNALRERGLGERTIYNKHSRLSFWLVGFAGLEKSTFPPAPRPDDKLPVVYTSAILRALMSEADEEESIALQLGYKLGLRSGEACTAEFGDLSFAAKTLRVRNKPHYDFKVKDRGERDLPIPDDFMAKLVALKKKYPNRRLLLGGQGSRPYTKFELLWLVKSVATRAGVVCGQCGPCVRGLTTIRQCLEFTFKRFRSTYITGLLLSGMDVRSVQALAGHAKLETTLRYLCPVSTRASQPMVSAIDWESPKFAIGL